MITCPRCGTVNGVRRKNPVKCTRCWYVFEKWSGEIELSGRGVGVAPVGNGQALSTCTADRTQEHGSHSIHPAAPIKIDYRDADSPKDPKAKGNYAVSEQSVPGMPVHKATMPSSEGEPVTLRNQKIDIPSLRDICAGKIPKHVQEPETEPEEEPEPEVLYCRIAECGKAMVQTKGWWVCPDVVGCPMGGIQQKKVVQ